MDNNSNYVTIPLQEMLKMCKNNSDFFPIEIQRTMEKKLKTNLIIPSQYLLYSLCIEYMSNFFYSKFPKDFFKHKRLDTSHIMDDLRKIETKDLIVINKPAAHIVVDEDQGFNRNNLDLYNAGATLYENRARLENSFFMDRTNNIYIAFRPYQVKLTFGFSIKVSTKAVQDDVAKLCEIIFRSNGTQKHYIDFDAPVPKELIGQIATDRGMCKNGEYDVYDMLAYLNSNSKIPFIYKFNSATGNLEYFVRMPHAVLHIKTSAVRKDQANMRNMSAIDYTVSFECEVRFPSVLFYAYYSMVKRESINSFTQLDAKSILFTTTSLCNIPDKNAKGWNWLYRKTCTLNDKEEVRKIKNGELLDIDLLPLLNNDLITLIEYNKSIYLNPELFMDIKAFNFTKQIPINIDWNSMKLKFTEALDTQEVYIVFYVDMNYVNQMNILFKKMYSTRISDAKDNIGPLHNLGTKLVNLDRR